MESNPTREEAENAAAAWLLKREGEHWTDADRIELDRWLQASPGHRVSFMRLQAIWSDTERLRSLGAGLPKGQIPLRGTIEQSPFFAIKRGETLQADGNVALPSTDEAMGVGNRSSPGLSAVGKRRALSASLLLAFGAALVVCVYGYSNRSSTFETPVGAISTVPLKDGSIVTLNTNSEMQVRFSGRERRVKLKRGEAFFEVAKDPTRPFAVDAGDRRVVAVGTKFSVRLSSKAVRVAVTEGKVRLEQRPSFLDLKPPARDSGANGEALTAGAIADVDDLAVDVRQQPIADIDQILSWRAGHIVLNETPLADAVAEFNRYNEQQIIIDDPALRAIRVEGNFRVTNIDGFVRLLEQGFQVRARQAQDGKVVLSRKP